MLIAVMSDTFDKVKETESQAALRETIELISDYVVIVPKKNDELKVSSRFIFAIRPKSASSEEGGGWEGTVT